MGYGRGRAIALGSVAGARSSSWVLGFSTEEVGCMSGLHIIRATRVLVRCDLHVWFTSRRVWCLPESVLPFARLTMRPGLEGCSAVSPCTGDWQIFSYPAGLSAYQYLILTCPTNGGRGMYLRLFPAASV